MGGLEKAFFFFFSFLIGNKSSLLKGFNLIGHLHPVGQYLHQGNTPGTCIAFNVVRFWEAQD